MHAPDALGLVKGTERELRQWVMGRGEGNIGARERKKEQVKRGDGRKKETAERGPRQQDGEGRKAEYTRVGD